MNLLTQSERAHGEALAAARRAIRAGDLAKAERWMKLAERHYRCGEYARAEATRWRKMRARIAKER